MPWEQELLQHMDLQLTEAPAEGDLLRRGDALLAEHQHMVVQVRPVDTAEVLGGQGQPEVEAEHLGAECGIEGTDLQGNVGARWRRKETDIADSHASPDTPGTRYRARRHGFGAARRLVGRYARVFNLLE